MLRQEFASDAHAHREGYFVRFVTGGAVTVFDEEIGVHKGVHGLIRVLKASLDAPDRGPLGCRIGATEGSDPIGYHLRRAKERNEDGFNVRFAKEVVESLILCGRHALDESVVALRVNQDS